MSRIYRTKRDEEHPYVVIDKTGPEDPRLSWKAKGILAYILCKPDDWKIFVSELCKHAKDGKDSTGTGINELIKFGYVIRTRIHDPKTGHFQGYDYEVFERPQTLENKAVSGKSVNGKSVDGKPATTKERKKVSNKKTKGHFVPPSNKADINAFKNLVFARFKSLLTKHKIPGARHWAIAETNKWWNHYSSPEVNWRVGRRKMVSWEQTVVTWITTGREKRRYRYLHPDDPAAQTGSTFVKGEETPTMEFDQDLVNLKDRIKKVD